MKTKILTTIAAIGLSGLLALPPAQAGIVYHTSVGHRHWHHWHGHHYHRGGFGPGVFLGATFGFLAGAAIANHGGYQCRQVYVNCYRHYGFYGPYRTCYRTVRWVC